MDLNETAVFVKVIEAGSFSAAARQLGVTLIQRTTRRLHLTEAGELF